MEEEATAEARRRRADGENRGGFGYGMAGNAADFDRQRRLIDDIGSGDFAQSIDNGLEKYQEDTSPTTRNYAPKECWPSTGMLRTVSYEAGKSIGTEAATLLEQIPDNDLRLFASIELAAALAAAPPPKIMHIRQPNSARPRTSFL